MILGTAVIVAGATYAVFHDTATVSGSTFSTGDADLIKIKMPDNNSCADWSDSCSGVSWSGLYPGWNRSYDLYLKNVSDVPIIIQTIPVIVENSSNQNLWDNTYMEIVCTGNASTGRYSLTAWKSNAAVEIVPQLRQNEESPLCEVKFDVATSASNEIASVSIGFNLVLNANQVGEGTVEPTVVCGNGTIESGEQCDDNNIVAGDGCSATCQTETPSCVSTTEVCDGKDNDCDGTNDEEAYCAAVPNSNPFCSAGTCIISACYTGYGNCDQNALNGCEIDLKTSNSHCGSCGHVCTGTTNGTATCNNGACGISCNAGYTNCTDRCVNTQTDPANCGGCGHVCLGGICSNGACQ